MVSFADLMPVLVVAAGVSSLLWLVCWWASRWLAPVDAPQSPRAGVRRALERAARMLRHATGAVTLVIAVLVMLYGLGLRGLPSVSWAQVAQWVRGSGLPLVFIFGSALVLVQAAGMAARHLPGLLVPGHLPIADRLDRRKRVETRGRLARWLFTGLVLGIATVMALRTLGVDTTPLLAGGAFISVALGFGAQDLVRDIIGGLSMILEDQLRVGDIVEINGKSGQVEAIHLRTTVLRALNGTVHVIPNGSIKDLSNMTKHYAFALIDVGVGYGEDVDRVMRVLREVGAELVADPAQAGRILAPFEVMGVQDFAPSAVVIRTRLMTVPADQWSVARELRRRIKMRFDAEGIEIPLPHLALTRARREGDPDPRAEHPG